MVVVSYREGILDGIAQLGNRHGSSLSEIRKYLQANNNSSATADDKENHWKNGTFLMDLRALVSAGDLVSCDTNGGQMCYRLSPAQLFQRQRRTNTTPQKVTTQDDDTTLELSTPATALQDSTTTITPEELSNISRQVPKEITVKTPPGKLYISFADDNNEGGILISKVEDHSPLSKRGVSAGDTIVEFEGEDVRNKTVHEFRAMVKAKFNFYRSLTIVRSDDHLERLQVKKLTAQEISQKTKLFSYVIRRLRAHLKGARDVDLMMDYTWDEDSDNWDIQFKLGVSNWILSKFFRSFEPPYSTDVMMHPEFETKIRATANKLSETCNTLREHGFLERCQNFNMSAKVQPSERCQEIIGAYSKRSTLLRFPTSKTLSSSYCLDQEVQKYLRQNNSPFEFLLSLMDSDDVTKALVQFLKSKNSSESASSLARSYWTHYYADEFKNANDGFEKMATLRKYWDKFLILSRTFNEYHQHPVVVQWQTTNPDNKNACLEIFDKEVLELVLKKDFLSLYSLHQQRHAAGEPVTPPKDNAKEILMGQAFDKSSNTAYVEVIETNAPIYDASGNRKHFVKQFVHSLLSDGWHFKSQKGNILVGTGDKVVSKVKTDFNICLRELRKQEEHFFGEKEIRSGVNLSDNNPGYLKFLEDHMTAYHESPNRNACLEQLSLSLLNDGWYLTEGKRLEAGQKGIRDNRFVQNLRKDLHDSLEQRGIRIDDPPPAPATTEGANGIMFGEKEIRFGIPFASNNPAYVKLLHNHVHDIDKAADKTKFAETLLQSLINDGWYFKTRTGDHVPEGAMAGVRSANKIQIDLYACLKHHQQEGQMK